MTAKGDGNVVLQAIFEPVGHTDGVTWEADGATITAPGVDGDVSTARLSRASTGKIPVRIKRNGRTLREGVIWVVWATLNEAKPTISTGDTSGTTADNTTGPGAYVAVSAGRFTARVAPTEIFTDADRPDLAGSNSGKVPGADVRHVISNNPLSGGADQKWDMSRRIRIRLLNKEVRSPEDHPKVDGRLWDGVHYYCSIPEDYSAIETIGNDDVSTADEENDPYDAKNPGKLVGGDTTIRWTMRHSVGTCDNRCGTRVHFGEFVRVQAGDLWLRISDFADWKVHFLFEKVDGQWRDAHSYAAADNADFDIDPRDLEYATVNRAQMSVSTAATSAAQSDSPRLLRGNCGY